MNNVLLTAGVACVIIALVGGGATAFGVQVPILDTRTKQIMLAFLGIAFLAGAVLLREDGGRASEEVVAYRQEVLATCRSSSASTNAFAAAQNPDLTFDRARLLQALRTQASGFSRAFKELWRRDVPHELQEDADAAKRAVRRLVSRSRSQLDQAVSSLPATLTFEQLNGWSSELDANVRGPLSRAQAALGRLAGQPCEMSPTEQAS